MLGQADGDSRWFKALHPLFVKTARTTHLRGYVVAIANDGIAVADVTTYDGVRFPHPLAAPSTPQ